MVFLDKLNRTPYGQFYANETNIVNADPTKVPKTIGEVYQKAKAYVIIDTSTKSNGTPVSFATTAERLLKSNKKKTPSNQGPRGQQTNNPNNGLYVSNTNAPTTPPNVPPVPVPVAAPTTTTTNAPANAPESPPTNNQRTPKDLSRVQCYNCHLFGHFARDCTETAINGMTMDGAEGGYYQPKWYEVGLDTMSQVNVLNSRFLTDYPMRGKL